MKFDILTLFPQMFEWMARESITKRAISRGFLSINAVNIRDFSTHKNKNVDDYPYGGGCGMLMQAEPIFLAHKSLIENSEPPPHTIFLSPQGRIFNQNVARELSVKPRIILLCGHYEGVDQRVIDTLGCDEISLGDFILTGGEIAAMAMIDAITRLIPGTLGNPSSSADESFSAELLEYPQYTRPAVWRGKQVPEILLSGNHAEIKTWRINEAEKITKKKRPDH